eukprot:351886-Chlamydomonas_euryale.AAC.3
MLGGRAPGCWAHHDVGRQSTWMLSKPRCWAHLDVGHGLCEPVRIRAPTQRDGAVLEAVQLIQCAMHLLVGFVWERVCVGGGGCNSARGCPAHTVCHAPVGRVWVGEGVWGAMGRRVGPRRAPLSIRPGWIGCLLAL